MVGRAVCRLIPCLAVVALWFGAACQPGGGVSGAITCYPSGQCFDGGGTQVCEDANSKWNPCGTGVTASTNGTGTGTGTTGSGTGGTLANTTGSQPPILVQACDCRSAGKQVAGDTDGDCITDAKESAHNNSDLALYDTDGDGISDGCEDVTHDGVYTVGLDTDPRNPDSDCDGLWDGVSATTNSPLPQRASVLSALSARNPNDSPTSCWDATANPSHYTYPDGTKGGEDRNGNGYVDLGETDPRLVDSDRDNIPDGLEDANLDGKVAAWVDTNGDGCYTPGTDTPGESDPSKLDTDSDSIGDGVEDKNFSGTYDPSVVGLKTETAAWLVDTDCDKISDGTEDKNHNGILDATETSPRLQDSDGDGLCDGKEDINHNGAVDTGKETNPLLLDTDGDGIPDGVENRDPNNVNCAGPQGTYGPANANSCWDGTLATMGASDPRKADTDGDGIKDGLEDTNHDGICQTAQVPNPINPSQTITQFIETCAFTKDTDCDGLTDSLEDKNANGVVDIGETDPRLKDTDFDTLQDGCKPAGSNNPPGCEDKNSDGLLQSNETDPTSPDTDGDLLSDSCELNFAPNSNPAETGPTDPLKIDTDGDGVSDGDEDVNHNCKVDAGETDPRHYDAPPTQGSSNFPQYQVCASNSLNNVTFAEDARSYADVRIAFEEERAPSGAACPHNVDSDCPSGQNCLGGQCVTQAPYIIQAFGADNDNNGFDENDQNDTLWGWAFQSPPGVAVDATTGVTVNRDIYGFVQLSEDNRALDDILDSVRDLLAANSNGTVTQTGSLPQRAAFDSTAIAPVNFAQREFSFALTNSASALGLRNKILTKEFLAGQTIAPSTVPPTIDPVYGTVNCGSGGRQCFQNFTLYMTAVQRPKQIGPNGMPVVVMLVALTENDTSSSSSTATANRLYPDRLARLQDLTGGSAIAHFNASTGKACDTRPQTPARADVLWVVDDSRSMQAIISRLEAAANSAKSILTSNSGILDYRIGMTTTNPSPTGGTQCPGYCDNNCNGTKVTIQPSGAATSAPGASWCYEECADQDMGCVKSCAPACVQNATVDPNGYTTCSSCTGDINNSQCGNCTSDGNCTGFSQRCVDKNNPNSLIAAIAADGVAFNRALPGGGGTFYYEDTAFLDCDSYGDPPSSSITAYDGQSLQFQFVNSCVGNSNGFHLPLATGNIPQFFGSGNTRVMLTGNKGMIGADPNVVLTSNVSSCNLTMLDLNSITVAANDCTRAGTCCGRLTQTCDDGATVFGSQMCDLIRAMGGLPSLWAPGVSTLTSGARRHSAPEQGSRSARRLVSSMIPALPLDYNPSRDNMSGDSNTYDPKLHLRLNCNGGEDPTCRACNPQTNSSCTPIPLATIVISDEEDFYFKDDCQTVAGNDPNALNGGGADMTELPLNCVWADGDPTTVDDCSAAYCSTFQEGNPNGYSPDQAAWTTDGFYTLKWRNANAAECSPSNLATTCLADPCPTYTNQSACQNAAAAPTNCVWTASNLCLSQCANITHFPAFGSVAAGNQRTTCENNALCTWDQSQAGSNTGQAFANACRLKTPINDCQACKRYTRLQTAINGNINAGLGKVGPVYAITRNKGQPGFGSWLTAEGQDTCQGGAVTWGRGDGQAYRDIATATLGRIQDVCAGDYTSFLQLLVGDLAVLSKPYPLSGKPIAATLKVGISRPVAGNSGAFTYVAVPRSQSSGFFYDATGNTIGFKSDPVDGQCATPSSCTANGVIDQSEIAYALTAPFVPQPGDQIYVSYRTWNPVPCGGACAVGQTCAEVVCTAQATSSCPNAAPNDPNANAYCAPGYTCQSGSCVQTCTTGALVEACVNQPECQSCQDYNSTTRQCDPIPDTCTCSSGSGQSCNPLSSINSCPIGYACDESCVCAQNSGCAVAFNNNGSINCGSTSGTACGQAAVTCCNNFANTSATQTTLCGNAAHSTKSTCSADSSCIWRGTATSGECGARVQPCCPAGSTPNYYVDPELGSVNVICTPATCECCCAAGLECDPSAPPPPGPSNSCPDGAPACACYNNGG